MLFGEGSRLGGKQGRENQQNQSVYEKAIGSLAALILTAFLFLSKNFRH